MYVCVYLSTAVVHVLGAAAAAASTTTITTTITTTTNITTTLSFCLIAKFFPEFFLVKPGGVQA